MDTHAIGIFDSGMGGLTVAHAVSDLLPHEDLIYVGDTAHLPYGDKSAATIQQYVRDIADYLLAKKCKLILVACNSATAAAFDNLQGYVGGQAELLGVIDPVVDYVALHHGHQKIGLIGTKQTVHSQVFLKKLRQKNPHIQFSALATPLLVPMIEEGFHEKPAVVQAVLDNYLQHSSLTDIEVLILGCTHYPLLKNYLHAYYGKRVELIDASVITAQACQKRLQEKALLNRQTHVGQREFYVSDLTPAFQLQAQHFFGESLSLELLRAT